MAMSRAERPPLPLSYADSDELDRTIWKTGAWLADGMVSGLFAVLSPWCGEPMAKLVR
ncbi:MAG: hypothetical protein GXP05_00125 [Alphaproteobacteria bacterium]|nr:hypothetical protein [Alphaproteobacteria bacterium]